MQFFAREKHNLLPIIFAISFVVFVLSLIYLATSYFGGTPTYETRSRGDGLIVSNAKVEEIKVLIVESNPIQVNVVATGNLPDPCTMVDEIVQYKKDNTFFVTIRSSKPHDAVCAQAIKQFEQVIPLDVTDLEKGEYKVSVNGVEGNFVLK